MVVSKYNDGGNSELYICKTRKIEKMNEMRQKK